MTAEKYISTITVKESNGISTTQNVIIGVYVCNYSHYRCCQSCPFNSKVGKTLACCHRILQT